ncbi:uncharacterized protein [Mytilus edulis]|uniref:uncharacterized protein n=1 Tax=Mytilus edulis TaxID=6550 RepID=UPI0039EE2C45
MDKDERNNDEMTQYSLHDLKHIMYPGKRRYGSQVQESYSGFLSNDIFAQFEKEFKSCLKRRQQKKQWIINLLYPIKSTIEYFKYLEKFTNLEPDIIELQQSDTKYMESFNILRKIVGTEADIRIRQRLFIIQDMINNVCAPYVTSISSGSLAEGMDLPGSDVDVTRVITNVHVVQTIQHIKSSFQYTTLLMETVLSNPGFIRLKLVADGDRESKIITSRSFVETTEGMYLSSNLFVSDIVKQIFSASKVGLHGPCISDKNHELDFAYCLRVTSWPEIAKQWIYRHRREWPPNNVIEKVVNYGCLMVPIGPKYLKTNNLMWRLSFSVAEKHLVHSFNYTLLLCYGLLKLSIMFIIKRNKDTQDLLCSYFLKTLLFWVSEEISIETFHISNIFHCYFLCLAKLQSWISNCYCPNYFIPAYNMFRGKINASNNKRLLVDIYCIKCMGNTILNSVLKRQCLLLPDLLDESEVKQDFLLFRTFVILPPKWTDGLRALAFVESVRKDEPSSLILSLLERFHDNINKHLVQLSPPVSTLNTKANFRRYSKHLNDAVKTESVSGLLLYASFYYVTGKIATTLELIDNVLLRCTPEKILLGKCTYTKTEIKNYAQKFDCQSRKRCDRSRLGTIDDLLYRQHSLLIPADLQLEVEYEGMIIPPVVMAHCLKYLCFHCLNDTRNKAQALRDLYLTVREGYFISRLSISNSLTVLGVCYELNDEKDKALHSYHKALQCGDTICRSAAIRKSKLL